MYDLSFETLVPYDPDSSGITIDAELRTGGKTLLIPVRIDTGATHSIFSREIGESLGLNIETGSQILMATVNSTFVAYGHPVTLIAAGVELDSLVFFPEDDGIKRNVLGRRGWLDRVIVGINDYDGELYVSDYNRSL